MSELIIIGFYILIIGALVTFFMFQYLQGRFIGIFSYHHFDLENPRIILAGPLGYEEYTCLKCGKRLQLAYWQIIDLPMSMKKGCPGKKGG